MEQLQHRKSRITDTVATKKNTKCAVGISQPVRFVNVEFHDIRPSSAISLDLDPTRALCGKYMIFAGTDDKG